MALPNFIIIGAPKAGTTSLYHYLRQHPNVYMSPVKEPRFFINMDLPLEKAKTSIHTLSDYKDLFRDVVNEKAIGEASVGYLAHDSAAENIYKMLPSARLIAVIRNPVDRVISRYKMKMRDGTETRNFDEMLEESINIGLEKAPVLRQSFYASHFDRFLKYFDRSQLHIGLYEDYRSDNVTYVQRVFEFLDVDPQFQPNTSIRHNKGEYPKSRLIQRLVREDNILKDAARVLLPGLVRRRGASALSRLNQRRHPFEANESQRSRLIEIYRGDIERLQEVLGRDLQHWLSVK